MTGLLAAGSGALGGHGFHLLSTVVFLVVALGGVAAGERVRGLREERAATPSRRPQLLLPVMAVAGVGAASVHYVVTPDHFEEATLYGVFFLIAATGQLAYSALVVVRPSRPLVLAGVIGNFAMVVLWLVTRLVAIPLGPAAGTTEEFGGLDILASAFETVAVIAGLASLYRAVLPRRSLSRFLLRPQIGALVLVSAVAVVAVAAVSPPS